MLNLRNTLFTIALAMGTVALADQAFTPKLIIKNMTGEAIMFFAPENVIEQLKAAKSKYLHTYTIQALVMDDNYQEELQSIEISRIRLNPEDTLVLDSIPEYLASRDTRFLSPEEYTKCQADLFMFGSLENGIPVGDVKAFVCAQDLSKAQLLKKDIMIHLIKSDYAQEPSVLHPCTRNEQYLDIMITELVDRV